MTYKIGGEGGIRTRQDPLDSVSYRFHNADGCRECQRCRGALHAIARWLSCDIHISPTCLNVTRVQRCQPFGHGGGDGHKIGFDGKARSSLRRGSGP